MKPPPSPISTSRLTLRAWRVTDAPTLRAALHASDAHLRPWIPFMQQEPRTLEATSDWIAGMAQDFSAGRHARLGVWREEVLLGEVMLIGRGGPGTLEGGYWLHVDHVGQGYAREAMGALCEVAWADPDLDRLIFRCDELNGPSNALAERLGAAVTGVEVLEERGQEVRLQVWTLRRPV